MDTENNKHSLKEKILQKIAKGNVSPRSRYWFVGHEFFVWVLWLLAMAMGSLAIAISLFFIKYNYYALYEATHDSFFGFLIEALPYLWFFVLGAMLFWAIFNLRQTRRGYRYSLWQILTLCLSFSVFGGLALYISGVGFSFDRWLGDSVSIYESREKIAIKFWQKPEEGRLVGVLVDDYLVEVDKVKLLYFEDVTGVSWQIDVSEITEIDEGLLFSQKLVTLVGYMLSTETESELGAFHICGVLPWVYEKEKSMKELELGQRRVREGLWRYKNDETLIEADEHNLVTSLCANIKIVDRLRPIVSN